MPNAGAVMRRPITIEAQDDSNKDEGGGYEIAWTTYYSAFAKIEAWKGYERQSGQQPTASQIVRFTLRWPMQHTIDESMRVLYNGTAYNITDITDTNEGQREMVLTAERIKGAVGA